MKDPQNVTIALLLATAVILLALLLASYSSTDNAAYAAGTFVKQGDYILGAGAKGGNTDLVYVIDIAVRQLNVYQPDINTGTLDLMDSVDLGRAFRP
jgi:hypothetical protein